MLIYAYNLLVVGSVPLKIQVTTFYVIYIHALHTYIYFINMYVLFIYREIWPFPTLGTG